MSDGRLRLGSIVILVVSMANAQCATELRDCDTGTEFMNAEDLYELGRKCTTNDDHQAAVRLFCGAARQGYAKAQFRLGALYESGRGIPQHYSQAAKWYGLAAGQGHERARLRLGVMYAQGRGVCKDTTVAHAWLNLAAAQGNYEAAYERNRVEQGMSREEVAAAQRLAASADPQSQRSCGGTD